MKKLLLLLCLGFVLVGCGEKKVTEDMLIGDWECTMTGQEAKWKDSAFQNYGPLKNDKGLIKYFMKDNVLYFNFGNPTSYPFNLASYYNESEELKSDNDVNFKSKKSITYLSPDQFKTTVFSEITYDKSEEDNIKTKVEMDCKRAKVKQ